jgi:hypothetical protein
LSASQRLKRVYGLDRDYRTHTFPQLIDIETRVSASQRINRTYGVNVNWQNYTFSQLIDEELRLAQVRRAQPPATLGASATAPSRYSTSPSYAPSAPSTSSYAREPSTSGDYSRYYDYNYRPPVGGPLCSRLFP